MGRDVRWGEIPAGFKAISAGRRLALLRADMEHSLDLSKLSQENRQQSGFFGRGTLAVHDLDGAGAVLVRRYRHGGTLRDVTRDVFFTWPPRPFCELALTEEARRRGVSTVEPIAAVVEIMAGPFYRGWLVTRRLDDARDAWAAAQDEEISSAEKTAWLKAAAHAVRAM